MHVGSEVPLRPSRAFEWAPVRSARRGSRLQRSIARTHTRSSKVIRLTCLDRASEVQVSPNRMPSVEQREESHHVDLGVHDAARSAMRRDGSAI